MTEPELQRTVDHLAFVRQQRDGARTEVRRLRRERDEARAELDEVHARFSAHMATAQEEMDAAVGDAPVCCTAAQPCEQAGPASLDPPADDRDRWVDLLRPLVHRAVSEQVASWEETFPEGNPGTVVGLPDAVLVATQAVVDAGWRPAEPIESLVERSSLGTPEARAARESVPEETARAVVERIQAAEPAAEPNALREFREQLAAIEHERWAHWQRYLHSKCEQREDGSLVIPAGYVANLERQIATPYADLSEREKDSDRDQVNRYLPWLLHRPAVEAPTREELANLCERALRDSSDTGEQRYSVRAKALAAALVSVGVRVRDDEGGQE